MSNGADNRLTRHPDVYTAAEAAAYLGLESERSLESLRDKWGLRPLPFGRGLYHRRDLDAVVEAAMGQAREQAAGRAGRGRGKDTMLSLRG